MHQDREDLKSKLNAVTKFKLCKAREELPLRNTERNLSEELRSTQVETEMMSLQLEDLKQEISKMKYQITMIGICEASEKCKVEKHIANIVHHQNDFDNLFSKEHAAVEMHKLEIKRREEHKKELEEQKIKVIEEKNLLLEQEAKSIEEECDAIEQECVVLKKRNKAIMLKLRRKLIDSEDVRRALMKGWENTEYKL